MANLSDLARPATEAPLGSGMANMARNLIATKKAYKNYVIEAQTSGEEPISFEEFMKRPEGSNG